MLRGSVSTVVKNNHVTIKTTAVDSMVILWGEMDYIDFKPSSNLINSKIPKDHYDFRDSTAFMTMDVRFGGGQGDWGNTVVNPGLKVSVGKHIKQNRFLGLSGTLGYDYMFNLRADLVPVGVSLRGHFREGGLSAFYDLGVGYTFADDNNSNAQVLENNGGAYVNPSIGLISKKRKNVATYFKIGYNYTSYGESFNESIWQQGIGWSNVAVKRQYDLQSIRLSLGLYFD